VEIMKSAWNIILLVCSCLRGTLFILILIHLSQKRWSRDRSRPLFGGLDLGLDRSGLGLEPGGLGLVLGQSEAGLGSH
jgi:hypothetical protein